MDDHRAPPLRDILAAVYPGGHGEDLSNDAIARVCRMANRAVSADPLLRRYVAYLGAGGSAPNVEPWHALGQRLMAVNWLAVSGPASPAPVSWANTDADERVIARSRLVAIAALLTDAQPFLWAHEVERHVNASPPLPAHTVGRSGVPYPTMFWSYEKPHGTAQVQTDWALVMTDAAGLACVTPLVSSRGGAVTGVQFGSFFIPFGKRWPEDFGGAERVYVDFVLRRFAFLNSPYIGVAHRGTPRAIRREQARTSDKRPPLHEPTCAVVVLRRPVAAVSEKTDGPARVWQHHWWVAGHFRAQWRPSTRTHDVIWIAPYLKGDMSKPLLEKVYAVAR